MKHHLYYSKINDDTHYSDDSISLPHMYIVAAMASTQDSLQGRPQLTGLQATRQGSSLGQPAFILPKGVSASRAHEQSTTATPCCSSTGPSSRDTHWVQEVVNLISTVRSVSLLFIQVNQQILLSCFTIDSNLLYHIKHHRIKHFIFIFYLSTRKNGLGTEPVTQVFHHVN